ncbi:hypothetical protein DFH27DRAFT_523094 [Peziza echinospora]|nr:hypothetical protein DFH27DRAFT_523094 [Peziza echinospora]
MRPYKLLRREAAAAAHHRHAAHTHPRRLLSTALARPLPQAPLQLSPPSALRPTRIITSPVSQQQQQTRQFFFGSRQDPDANQAEDGEGVATIDIDVTTATAEDTVPGAPVLKKLVRYLDDKIGNAPSEEALLDGFDKLVGGYLDSKGEMKKDRELLEEHTHALMTTYEYLIKRKIALAEKEAAVAAEEAEKAAVEAEEEKRQLQQEQVDDGSGEENWRVLLDIVELEPEEQEAKPPAVVTPPLPIETVRRTLKLIHSSPNTAATLEFAKLLFYDLMSRPDTSFSTLRNALTAAAYAAEDKDEVKLARMLFTDMIHREGYTPHRDDFLALVHALGISGAAEDALRICRAAFLAYGKQAVDELVWEELLAGYVKLGPDVIEERMAAVWRAAVDEAKVTPTAGMFHQRIAFYCAKPDGLPDARMWWIHLKTSDAEAELRTYELLMDAYARSDKKNIADETLWYMISKIAQENMNRTPAERAQRKLWWGSALCWASTLGVGMKHMGVQQGVPSVEYIFNWMINANKKEGKKWVPLPDTELLNLVVEGAVDRGEFDLAAGLLKDLAPRYSLRPDWKTLNLQTRIQIHRNELSAAQESYEQMKRHLPPSANEMVDNGVELLALIHALCSKNAPYSKIRYLLDDLNERGVALSPQIILDLASYFLRTNYLAYIRPLLTHTLPTLSPAWRAELITIFARHITSANGIGTPLNSAWSSYLLLHHHFTPLGCIPSSVLINIMNAFFYAYSRSDMATTVLTHVHTSSVIGGEGGLGEPVPVEMYIACFNGLAKAGDMTNLSLVHSLLNLSPHLTIPSKPQPKQTPAPSSSSTDSEPAIQTLEQQGSQQHLHEPTTTPLLNALFSAYTTLGHYQRAFSLWNTIRRSRSGPDHDTISHALKLFGVRNGWIYRAHDLWRQLDSFNITPTQDNYARYVEAMITAGEYPRAFGVVKKMESVDGVAPGVTVLSMLYNTAPVEKRPEVVEWASEAYPAVFLPWFNRGLQAVNARRVMSNAN